MHLGLSNSSSNKFGIIPGIHWVSGYGIDIIEPSSFFPDDLITEANILSNKPKSSKDSVNTNTTHKCLHNTQNKSTLNTYEILQHILYNIPDDELYITLSALKKYTIP